MLRHLYAKCYNSVVSNRVRKIKGRFAPWQQNNPGALEEASTRGSAIHLGCENCCTLDLTFLNNI